MYDSRLDSHKKAHTAVIIIFSINAMVKIWIPQCGHQMHHHFHQIIIKICSQGCRVEDDSIQKACMKQTHCGVVTSSVNKTTATMEGSESSLWKLFKYLLYIKCNGLSFSITSMIFCANVKVVYTVQVYDWIKFHVIFKLISDKQSRFFW